MKKFFILSFLLLYSSFAIAGEDFLILTEGKYSPYSFIKRGKLVGISTDIIRATFKNAGMPLDDKSFFLDKWSNVMTQCLVTPNALIFAMSRTPEREKLFSWIGPIGTNRTSVISKVSNKISSDDPSNYYSYKIGVTKNFAGERFFQKDGGDIKRATRVSTYGQVFKLLQMGRVDAIVVDEASFFYWLSKHQGEASDYKVLKVLDEVGLYIGANKAIQMSTIEKLQASLDKLKTTTGANGKTIYDNIIDKYK